MKLYQEGTIYNLYEQWFPVVLKLDATDDGHLSGFVNFHGNVRPDGFPVGRKFRIMTNDPRADIIQQFLHLTIRFVNPGTAQVQGYIDGSDAEFQNVNTVANVQGELDERYAKMAIEAAKKSTQEDDKPHPKVGAVAVKHGQLLGFAFRCCCGNQRQEKRAARRISPYFVFGRRCPRWCDHLHDIGALP